jgi:hypothetical protein
MRDEGFAMSDWAMNRADIGFDRFLGLCERDASRVQGGRRFSRHVGAKDGGNFVGFSCAPAGARSLMVIVRWFRSSLALPPANF